MWWWWSGTGSNCRPSAFQGRTYPKLLRRGAAAGLRGALADRADEQVTEHLVWLRDIRLRDSLHRGMDDERCRALAKGLRGGRDSAGEAAGREAAGPLRGV